MNWISVVNSFGDASKRAYELFGSVGYGDKFFVLSIVDNVYDETSDIWFISVNGNTVFDVLK